MKQHNLGYLVTLATDSLNRSDPTACMQTDFEECILMIASALKAAVSMSPSVAQQLDVHTIATLLEEPENFTAALTNWMVFNMAAEAANERTADMETCEFLVLPGYTDQRQVAQAA
jgi:hypothetical protein